MAESSSIGGLNDPVLEDDTVRPVFLRLSWKAILDDVLEQIAPSLGDSIDLSLLERYGSAGCFGYEIDNSEMTDAERRMLEWARGRFKQLVAGLRYFPTRGRVGSYRQPHSDIETLLWGSVTCFVHNVFVPANMLEQSLGMVEQVAQLIPTVHPWRGNITYDTWRGKELLEIHKRIIQFFVEGIRFLRSTPIPKDREERWPNLQRTFSDDMKSLRRHVNLYERGEEPLEAISRATARPMDNSYFAV